MKITELVQLLDPPVKAFSGYLFLESQETTWTLSLLRGMFLYAEDKHHPVRRLNRLLAQYFPNYDWRSEVTHASNSFPWQVSLLNRGMGCQKLSLVRAKLMLRTLLQESLFELSLCDHLSHKWEMKPFPSSAACQNLALSSWETKAILGKVGQMQEQWQAAGLAQFSPVDSPTFKKGINASQLHNPLPINLSHLVGGFTLWEIARQINKPIVETTASLMRFVNNGTVELLPIPDLPMPAAQPANIKIPAILSTPPEPVSTPTKPQTQPIPTPQQSEDAQPKRSLIACIDDSPVLGLRLKKILEKAGYRTLIIQEPMRGFSDLIEHRPSLILLDLMLPNADGYSICKFLRETPVFKETPIVILTGKSKPVNFARARLAGATEFMVKPPHPERLLEIIHHHLDAETALSMPDNDADMSMRDIYHSPILGTSSHR